MTLGEGEAGRADWHGQDTLAARNWAGNGCGFDEGVVMLSMNPLGGLFAQNEASFCSLSQRLQRA